METIDTILVADRRAKRICQSEQNLSYVAKLQYKVTIRKKGFGTACKTFDDVDDAVAWRNIKIREMQTGQFRDEKKARTTTLADILKRYANEVVPIITTSETSAKKLVHRINKLSERAIGEITLDKLHPVHIQSFRDERKLEVKRKTLKEDLSEISRVIEYARFEWGITMTQGNPVNVKLLLKHVPADHKTRQPIKSPAIEKKFIQACEDYGDGHTLRDLVEFALETGMRRTQLISLRWENIDFDRRIAKVLNKDRKNDGQEYIEVPLLLDAIKVLNKIGVKDKGAVFAAFSDPASVTRAMARVREQNKHIKEFADITPHTLRHTMVHKLKKKGVRPEIAKIITGHKTDQMHAHYGKLDAEDVISILDE